MSAAPRLLRRIDIAFERKVVGFSRGSCASGRFSASSAVAARVTPEESDDDCGQQHHHDDDGDATQGHEQQLFGFAFALKRWQARGPSRPRATIIFWFGSWLALDELEGGQHALQVTQNPLAVKLDYSRRVSPDGAGMDEERDLVADILMQRSVHDQVIQVPQGNTVKPSPNEGGSRSRCSRSGYAGEVQLERISASSLLPTMKYTSPRLVS